MARTVEERIALVNEWQEVKAKGEETMKEFAKRHGIRETYIYSLFKKFGHSPIAQSREIKHVNGNEMKLLKIENQRLKIIVADQALDIQAMKEYIGRK